VEVSHKVIKVFGEIPQRGSSQRFLLDEAGIFQLRLADEIPQALVRNPLVARA
jgi:hypothetical protein